MLMSPPRASAELVLIRRPEAVIYPKWARFASRAARNDEKDQVEQIVEASGCSLRRLFGEKKKTRAFYGAAPAVPPHKLDDFYCVQGDEAKLAGLAIQLRGLESVLAAYVRPGAELAGRVGPPALPSAPGPRVPSDFRAMQRHLGPPPGIDARSAWATPGARGDGVTIVDVEWAWRFDHDDIAGDHWGVVAGVCRQEPFHLEHGTAVLGVLGARHDGAKVEGIVPHARLGAVALPSLGSDPGAFSLPLAEAIRVAADRLGRGDILLLEVHLPGPRHGFTARRDELGYIAPEWWPDVLAAVRYAVGRGVVVVEAAGNGAEDLDAPLYEASAEGFPSDWSNPFRAGNTSGAVLVAAGSPDDRVPMGYSNYGSCIDAHGWGDGVVTTGYGDLHDDGPTRKYTYTFGGTSSAAAMVAGALASVQGVLRDRGKMLLDAEGATRLLRALNATSPHERSIGNLPNVPKMIELALQ
jgi:subtilase family protein